MRDGETFIVQFRMTELSPNWHVYQGAPFASQSDADDAFASLKKSGKPVRMFSVLSKSELLGEWDPVEAADDSDRVLIWSIEHNGWWRANECGYTASVKKAGRYSRSDAEEIVKGGNIGLSKLEVPHEAIVPVSSLGD